MDHLSKWQHQILLLGRDALQSWPWSSGNLSSSPSAVAGCSLWGVLTVQL